MFRLPVRILALVVSLSLLNAQTLSAITGSTLPSKSIPHEETVRLPGHVLPALSRATAVNPSTVAKTPMTLTLVLNPSDQAGFDRYLHDVYDSHSPSFRHFLTPLQISDRFGPSQQSYDAVLHYLEGNGFKLIEGSANRMTITVRGSRKAVDRTFGVQIRDYRIADESFYANDSNPALPIKLASNVQAVLGLSNLAQPHGNDSIFQNAASGPLLGYLFVAAFLGFIGLIALFSASPQPQPTPTPPPVNNSGSGGGGTGPSIVDPITGLIQNIAGAAANTGNNGTGDPPPGGLWTDFYGAGQIIGLLEFDTFQMSDVSNYLSLMGLPASRINNLSEVKVNGGAQPGPYQGDVLLGIDTVLSLAQDAKVVVYDAPFTGAGTSFQALFNAMINGGVTVIANTWSYCEDQTSLADVQSIDTILANAAASGITVFNATGDSGSACNDGSPKTVAVPADSPNAVAVGGSSLTTDAGLQYLSETWWNGASDIPPTGQGGYGVSSFFSRPSYQNAFNTTGRSVPDVVANADPYAGAAICQQSAGGCPINVTVGATTMATATWAAWGAILNQAQGANLGFLNPLLYNLAPTNAFHNAGSMGSDFAHVGLGSPNLNVLHLLLSGQNAGIPDMSVSEVSTYVPNVLGTGLVPLGLPADGNSEGAVLVILRDSNGNTVSGKMVTLAANPGSSAVITPPSGLTSIANGSIIFKVTDDIPETVTFTATDTTDNVSLSKTPSLTFRTPPASSGGISANPTNVLADGSSTSTITVTLKDSLNRGTPGKQIILSQGNGHSNVNGPNPSVTDANGQIQFTATDLVTENVTYTATDVTDGNLAVPGSATVNFVNGSAFSCGNNQEVPQTGWVVTSPETGFTPAANCVGVSGTAWDAAGNLWALNYPTGKLYKFTASGGIAGSATLVGTVPGATPPNGLPTCPHGLAFSKDGQHLYLARQFCGSGGDVVEISTADASIIGNVTAANAIPCATGIATDPLSGDLFVTSPCQSGNDLYRIANPESATPTVSVYASPGRAIGINFTPDGTIWTEAYPFNTSDHMLVKVSGTNSAQPATVTVLSTNAPQYAGGVLPVSNPASPGSPSFLLVSNGTTNGVSGSVVKVDLTQNPPVITTVATGGAGEIFVNGGPDGCAYVSNSDRIDRITNADGSCSSASSSPFPMLSLSPVTVMTTPSQGSSQTFTATLQNATTLSGVPVTFHVTGANPQLKLVVTDANGQASFSYTGFYTGLDSIVASVITNGSSLISNQATATWASGKHVTFLTLAPTSSGAAQNQQVSVKASLTDVSTLPAAGVAGQTINFMLGSQTCSGITDSTGIATCQLTPSQAGIGTLTATFAGTNQFVGSNSSVGFNVVSPPSSVARCPLSQGYWKNHPAAWPVTSLKLGTQTYSQSELLKLLGSSSTSDASLILARQLIAAKLSLAHGSDPTPISSTVADADQRLGAFAGKLPYGVKTSSTTGQAMVNDANKLNSYNNGALTPTCKL